MENDVIRMIQAGETVSDIVKKLHLIRPAIYEILRKHRDATHQIKKGDWVAMESSTGRRLLKVDRTTKMFIFVGQSKFYRIDGSEIRAKARKLGDHQFTDTLRLRPATPVEVKSIS
jgi:hypothetical protein